LNDFYLSFGFLLQSNNMSLNFVLLALMMVQLAFAAPFICGEIGVTTTLEEIEGPKNKDCDFHFTCELTCPCQNNVIMMDVKKSPSYSNFAAAWMTSGCYGRAKENRCSCESFFNSIGTPSKEIIDTKNSFCNCPKKKKGKSSFVSKEVREVAKQLEFRASELEQKAHELEEQAESLEME
jgi:hypothetical protein